MRNTPVIKDFFDLDQGSSFKILALTNMSLSKSDMGKN